MPSSNQSKLKKAKLSRKQLRRKILADLRQKRYYSQRVSVDAVASASPASFDPSQSTLSNKMWLYLEMKKQYDAETRASASSSKTLSNVDYVKYLSENKNDIEKWLEFIDTQEEVYERKASIYEKAIKENPTCFRLKMELLKVFLD